MSGTLAGRLALLSRQAGRLPSAAVAAPAAPTATPSATSSSPPGAPASPVLSFAQRMHRLEARADAFVRPTDEALAARLGGRLRQPGLIEMEHRHPLDVPHGAQPFGALVEPDLAWLTGPQPEGCRRGELVFIDTETTGLAGGTGTLAFLVGIARVCGTALVVTQWMITCFSAEQAMLEALLAALGPSPPGTTADDRPDASLQAPAEPAPIELVSYNGKSFDLPLLVTRLKLARMRPSLANHRHHDLLHPLRTAFARRWPDCRLQTAERLLLGIDRVDDLPGHRIPAVWADFVQFGETRELDALVRHNRIDLLSLAALLPALGRVYLEPAAAAPAPAPAPARPALQLTPDSASIARMQRRRRRPECARAHLLAAQPALDSRALTELADLHRSRGDWNLALPIWLSLADAGSIGAIEALAKYHEHVTRDLDEAARWCAMLCRQAPTDPAHRRRLDRLQVRRQSRQARSGALFGTVSGTVSDPPSGGPMRAAEKKPDGRSG